MDSLDSRHSHASATALGLIAALFWATSIAISRVTSEAFGYFTVAAMVYTTAGLCSCAAAAARGDLVKILRLPKRYLIGCGALMPLYTVGFYLGVGLAKGSVETIEAGLINYLWPALVVAFSVPILGFRWRWPLLPGILAGVAGIFIAVMDVAGFSLAGMHERFLNNAAPYGFGLLCAVTWALYSNLNRRWGKPHWPSPMPVLMLATGLMFCVIRFFHAEHFDFTPKAAAAVAYSIIFPTTMAYIFWDIAMRRGNFTIVSSASYLTPLLSTGISCFILRHNPGPWLWVGAALVVAGAVTCKFSLREAPQEA
jgi:drug/metabolite transporter (DMT)-like permease